MLALAPHLATRFEFSKDRFKVCFNTLLVCGGALATAELLPLSTAHGRVTAVQRPLCAPSCASHEPWNSYLEHSPPFSMSCQRLRSMARGHCILGGAPVRSACQIVAPSECTSRRTCMFSLKAASELRSDVVEKRCSAVDVVTHHLELIKANEDRLGSFLHVDEQGALAQARHITS